jgi:hypothetical protein
MNFDFKIYAVDCDGTLCADAFPEFGEPNMELINKLIKLRNGGDKLILWTCRNKELTDKAVEWAKQLGLSFDAVNDDISEVKETDFGKDKSVKPYYDFLIDDKNRLPAEFASSEGEDEASMAERVGLFMDTLK